MSGFGDILRRQREARFVGRAREIASFRAWLEDPDATRPITSITGAGGIGKTWLMAALTACADELGWNVVAIDGHHVVGDRVGLARALAGCDSLDDAIAALNRAGPTLLAVDTFEAIEPMAGLMQDALTQLDSRARAVFCGRNPLAGSWRRWESLIRVQQLGGLSVEEQFDYLNRRGIAGWDEQWSLMARSGGHPLTLSLACDLVVEQGTTDFVNNPEWGRAIAGVVAELRATGDETLVAALEAAAVLGTFNSARLDALCPTVDGSEAMARLVRLSMVRPTAGGFELHDDVRSALIEDLRLHRPERLEEVRSRALRHLFDIRGGGDDSADIDAITMVGRSLFELSLYWVRTDERERLRLEEATPAAVDELLAIQRPFHPFVQPPPEERSPLLLPRLIDHDDAQVRLVRDALGEAQGYGFWVALSTRTADLFAAGGAVDGAVAAALSRLGTGALPDGPSSFYYLSSLAMTVIDPGVASALAVDVLPLFARGGAYLGLSADQLYTGSLEALGFERIGYSWSSGSAGEPPLEAFLLDLSRTGVTAWLTSLASGKRTRQLPLGDGLVAVVERAVAAWDDDDALAHSPLALTIDEHSVTDDARRRADAVRRLMRQALASPGPWPTLHHRVADALLEAGITKLPAGRSLRAAMRGPSPAPFGDVRRTEEPDTGGISIRLMGEFALSRSGRTVDVGTGIVARLVKMVAGRGTCTADELVEDLWPEGDPVSVGARLRTTLYRVRQVAGADIIERQGREIRLAEGVDTDVATFVALADAALAPMNEGLHDPDLVSAAIRAYGGELLPADRYEDWSVRLRERLERTYLSLLDLAADLAEDRGDLKRAIAHLERAIEVDRFDETRYVRAAGLFLLMGWPSRAKAMCRRAADAAASLEVDVGASIRELEAKLAGDVPS